MAGPASRCPVVVIRSMSSSCSVTFINSFAEGHHLYYASVLASGLTERGIKIYAVGPVKFVEAVRASCPIVGSKVVECSRAADVTELEKRRFLEKALNAARSFDTDLIHLHQLDRYIFSLFFLKPFSNLSGLLGTLHWAAILDEFATNRYKRLKNRAERMVLRNLIGRGFRVMVHSKEFTFILNRIMGADSADYIPYPVDFPSPCALEREVRSVALRARLDIPADATVMLCFGGTRFEKGADIAVRALKDLPDNVYLLVAGIEEHFSREDLRSLGEELGVVSRLRLCMEYVPEAEVVDYFIASDVVVAPYRKMFAGQCGPLTIAAALGVPVAGSDSMIIKETVDKYSLGSTFPAEDAQAFASSVLGLIEKPCKPRTKEFAVEHGKTSFCDSVAGCYVRTFERK